MTEEQLKMMEDIIRNETDLKQLNDLKNFISNEVKRKVDAMQVSKDSDDVLTPSQIVTLLGDLKDFIDNNLPKKTRWRWVYYGIQSIEKVDQVKVYHLLKLGPNGFLRMRETSEVTLSHFEQALNKLDLSFYKPLSEKQIQMLEKIEKNGFNVANYMPMKGNISFTVEQIDVLLESVRDFTIENIPTGTNYRRLLINLDCDSECESKVYHLINYGEKKLLRYIGVGPATVATYEEALNKYGLSLHKSIPFDEIELLKREEKRRQKIKKSS